MDNQKLNKALLFTADYFNNSNHNFGKPVFLHTIRVFNLAMQLNYNEDIVISAILHDLVEDTDCTIEIIKKEWGEYISQIVDALTIEFKDEKILGFKKSIDKCVKIGKDALIVRCLDVIDNMAYFELADEDTKKYLIEKYHILYETCSKMIPSELAFLRFKEKLFTIKDYRECYE